MSVLVLLGPARDVAGLSRVEIPGDTVGEVLDRATDRFGEEFAQLLSRSQVWVNTEPATRQSPVADHDEVNVLPPVSGG